MDTWSTEILRERSRAGFRNRRTRWASALNHTIPQAIARLVYVRLSASAFTLVAISTLLAGCLDTLSDAHFATAEEARDAGYVHSGWIPPWLPDDATDIHEAHDVDTNISMLAFALPDPDALTLPDTCRPIEYAQLFDPPLERSWWPDEESLRTSYAFFRCSAEHTTYRFVGVSARQARVLHWRTYGN